MAHAYPCRYRQGESLGKFLLSAPRPPCGDNQTGQRKDYSPGSAWGPMAQCKPDARWTNMERFREPLNNVILDSELRHSG